METKGFVTIASADNGPFMEAYGLLLTSLLLANRGSKSPTVVAVTAAREGDGVSTTAINLSMMIAHAGRPAVLVDANMRTPALHKAFGVPQTPGLAEVLRGQAELASAVTSSSIPKLSILPAGQIVGPPQALFSQAGLSKFFGIMRDRYDFVVVDSPPILQYPDALHIAKNVDGVVQVIASRGASRRDQQETYRLLDRVGARILGTVLNRVPTRAKSLVD